MPPNYADANLMTAAYIAGTAAHLRATDTLLPNDLPFRIPLVNSERDAPSGDSPWSRAGRRAAVSGPGIALMQAMPVCGFSASP